MFGSIAQTFRGAVGTFQGDTIKTGYTKAYYYDDSFQNLWPPYFLPPAGATWYALSYVEFSPGCAASVMAGSNCDP